MAARSTMTKYTGAAVKGQVDADRLRTQVPDDPIKLPSGHLACEGCGVASAGPAILSVPLGPASRFSAEFTRCPDCQRLDGLAGDERTRNVLYALAVVGQAAPEDPAPLIPWLHSVSSRVAWLDPDAPTRDWCNPYPWAHVGIGQRAAIKEALLLAMRSRVRLGAPPLALPPPWGIACLFCGVGSVPMPPLEVARRGGRENAARTVWRSVVAQPKAFGGHGSDMVDGFVCPPCSEALDGAGSVNRACARAFEEHARSNGIRVPSGLYDLYADGHPVVVPGWASLGTRTPNVEPWAHVVIDEDAA
jgi:hypothetical protein